MFHPNVIVTDGAILKNEVAVAGGFVHEIPPAGAVWGMERVDDEGETLEDAPDTDPLGGMLELGPAGGGGRAAITTTTTGKAKC
jgi:hypothetical protein